MDIRQAIHQKGEAGGVVFAYAPHTSHLATDGRSRLSASAEYSAAAVDALAHAAERVRFRDDALRPPGL